jgi:hypothetical protein
MSEPTNVYQSAVGLFTKLLIMQLLSVATVTWVVNPMHLYPWRLVPAILVDDHTRKLNLLESPQQRPRLLVLGSSRVQLLEPAYLKQRTGLPAFNLGVANGQPEDALCLFRYATETRRLPIEEVILGVDVDAFTHTVPVNSNLRREPRLRRYLPPEFRPPWTTALEDLTKALTRDHLLLSIRTLRAERRISHKKLDPDGLVHSVEETRPPNLDFEMDLERQRFQEYSSLSPARLCCLEEIARRCHQRRIRLVVFLTSVHDYFVRNLAATYWPRHRDLVSCLSEMAGREGFTFMDCSRPESYGGDPNGFFRDASHVTVANARRIIDRITQRALQ